jgi:hypothetical protein
MGAGGGGSQTVTNKTELSPEQRQIMTSTMSKYMPGGQLPDQKNFDWNKDSYNTASNYVAPFSEDQSKAFQATRDSFGAETGTMDAAKSLTAAAANPTGTNISNSGMGWDGGHFDYNDAFEKSMNPYMTSGMDLLNQSYQQGLGNIQDTFSKSFGGSRQAVADASALQAHQIATGDYLRKSFDTAQNNANTMHNMGAADVGQNNVNDQANANRTGAMGAQLGDLGQTSQKMRADDINALYEVGNQEQAMDQQMRDTALQVQRGKENYGLTTAQAMQGFAPPGTQTQTTSRKVGGGQIFGSALGAIGSLLPMLSDENAKDDIEDADPREGLEAIRKLAPITYSYKEGMGQPTASRKGFTAQNAEEAGIQTADIGGYKHVDTQSLLEHVVHAIHALDAKIGGDKKRAA